MIQGYLCKPRDTSNPFFLKFKTNFTDFLKQILPIPIFSDSPQYRADPISDPEIGSALIETRCIGQILPKILLINQDN
jgi:hypothetical protein